MNWDDGHVITNGVTCVIYSCEAEAKAYDPCYPGSATQLRYILAPAKKPVKRSRRSNEHQ